MFSTRYDLWDFKDIERRTAADKGLRDKAFNIAKNLKYDGYQRGLASMVYKSFDKKSKSSAVNIPLEFNEQLAKELHKPIIRNLKNKQFIQVLKIIPGNNSWYAINKEFRFLLRVIDIFSKYAWFVPLKDKSGASIVDAFKKIFDDSDRKPNKLCLIKDASFTNNSFKK